MHLTTQLVQILLAHSHPKEALCQGKTLPVHCLSNDFRRWILTKGDLIVPQEYINRSLKALVDLFNYLSAEKKRLSNDVLKLAKKEKYVQRVKFLKSIPGIGVLSAMEILVEFQDVNRFKTADELAAYLGLTPSQYSSSERIRMGHITHAGSRKILR